MTKVFLGMILFLVLLFVYTRLTVASYTSATKMISASQPPAPSLGMRHLTAEWYALPGVLNGMACIQSLVSLKHRMHLQAITAIDRLGASMMVLIQAEQGDLWSDRRLHFSGHVVVSFTDKGHFPVRVKRDAVCHFLSQMALSSPSA